MTTRKKTQRGGKGGTLERVIDLENATTIGAGGYGRVLRVKPKNEVFKLFYDLTACEKLAIEAQIQQKAYLLFKKMPEVGIPKVTYYKQTTMTFNKDRYLCGIGMRYLPPPKSFKEAVHCILGHADDLDTSWGKIHALPISDTNPTRGFFASKTTLEEIWEEEGSPMTIEKLAYLMGKSLRLLIDNGIVPIDVEFIWAKGKPYIIDFGLCELGTVDPFAFLTLGGSRGLATDLYIPHKEDEGYDSFLLGFAST